ncbi:hypothetical protein MPER_14919, partial [Moniliophthora perniciosa FA553]
EFLIVKGNVDLGLPLADMGLDLGETSRTEDEEDALLLDEAEAEIAVVCGSIGSLLNDLNNQAGVSFDAKVFREGDAGRLLALAAVNCEVADLLDLTERLDRTEAWEGEELSAFTEIGGSALSLSWGDMTEFR